MGLIEIPFCDAMWDECRRVSLARSAPKRRWPGSFKGGPTSDEAHFLGVVGEAAVAFFLGVSLNRDIHNGDGHAPDIVAGGIGVEVKTSKYSPPHLKMNDINEFGRRSTIAVMVHADLDNKVATLWGFVDRRRFVEEHIKKDYGYGTRLVMKPPYTDMLVLKGIYR